MPPRVPVSRPSSVDRGPQAPLDPTLCPEEWPRFSAGVGTVETIFVLGWSLVGSVVPTPGAGAGTYHMATAAGLTRYLGYPESQVQPAVIILHLVVFGSPILFGLYYFLRSGFSVARLRELVAQEEAEAEAEKSLRSAPPREAEATQAANA